MAHEEYRLTAEDEQRIKAALAEAWSNYRPAPRKTANVVDTLERIAAHAIGCSRYDLRDSELAWIGDRVRDLKLAVTR